MSHKKVLGNTLVQILGKIATVATSFFVVKIISGFGTEFYGNYVTAYEFLAFFGILADAGLFAIAVREMSQRPNRTEFVLGNIFSMRLILIVAVSVLAGIAGQFAPNFSPDVRLGIWITAVSMALTIVAGTLSSVLQARMRIQFFTGSLVVGKIVLAGLIFAISRQIDIFSSPFFAFLVAGVISNVIFAGMVWFFATRETRISLKFDREYWRKTFKTSLPYGLALVLQTLYLRVDVILIAMILGAGSVGIYGLAGRIMESFLVIGVFFGQAFLPKISADESDPEKSRKSLGWGIEKCLIFSIPIVIGVFFFASDVVGILSSSEFLAREGFFGADLVLKILVPTVFFAFLNQLFTFTLVAKNRQNFLLLVNAVALGVNVALNLVFLPKFGIAAAAGSTVFCEILVFLILAREIFKKTPPKFDLVALGVIFFANFALFAGFYLTAGMEKIILPLAIGSFLYAVILWAFRRWLLARE